MNILGIKLIFLQLFTGHLCSAQKVKTSMNHEVVLGGNVTFKCALMGSDDVLQVTWQKLNGHSEKNTATFSKKYGSNIFGSFEGRATFIPSEVTVSIINLSGVRFEDEGCYQCLFNTFLDGAKVGKTCLSVHVMPEATLQSSATDAATNSNGSSDFVATCSATGRPAPVITWETTSSVTVLSTQSSTMVLDGRVKITSNLTVAKAGAADCKVICVVNHPALKRAITLEDFLQTTSSDQVKNKSPILIACAAIIIVVVCLAIWNWRNKLKSLIQKQEPGIPPNTRTTSIITEGRILELLNNPNDPPEENIISILNQKIKQRFSPSKGQNYTPEKEKLKWRSPARLRNLTCHSQNSSPYKILGVSSEHVNVNINYPSTPSSYLGESAQCEQYEVPCATNEKNCKRSLLKNLMVQIE
uniref:OX-2 membrane glycoprotein-like protein n=1 Tax=Callorhinchus milii TaxID=7868 RepID=V9KVN7_CALMI